MRNFNKVAAQGDVMFIKQDKLPEKGLTPVLPNDNTFIITHSETGHHHVMVLDKETTSSVEVYNTDNPLISWIKINRPTPLDHLRSHDTHESIMFTPGVYQVRRSREYTPEGFRKAQD